MESIAYIGQRAVHTSWTLNDLRELILNSDPANLHRSVFALNQKTLDRLPQLPPQHGASIFGYQTVCEDSLAEDVIIFGYRVGYPIVLSDLCHVVAPFSITKVVAEG